MRLVEGAKKKVNREEEKETSTSVAYYNRPFSAFPSSPSPVSSSSPSSSSSSSSTRP